ncbi:universal stress protein [Nitratireductor sp. CAU 1489]|uniref:Universal stress protein n=1 Tax=Nitratireductor arenosus TaxID=2682096 RepID=A0A844QGS0_9HYPH|nr:universal stress protein [Nitratireductor arenosus]MVA98602.1 universal stress protein [Nitratireductor arenosus]
MTIKTILAVTGLEANDDDLHLAAELCGEIDGHLSVLVLTIAAPAPAGEYAAMASDIWAKERQEDIERLRARTEAVSKLVAALPVPGDVASDYVEQAWADDAIGRRARYADLVLAGPGLQDNPILWDKMLEGVLFSSGTPLLLVPQGVTPSLRPERVTVAWDARPEASRAVRAALDLIVGAKEVSLALVDPVAGNAVYGEEPGADLAAYLSRHGAKVSVDRLPSQGHSVADVLCRHTIDKAADLMVMGAYGHSRLRERLFGGVTKSMLEQPPVPVLMAR